MEIMIIINIFFYCHFLALFLICIYFIKSKNHKGKIFITELIIDIKNNFIFLKVKMDKLEDYKK